MGPGRGRLPAWLTAAGLLLAVVGVAAYFLQAPTTAAGPGAGRAAQQPAASTRSGVEPVRAPWEAGAPRRVIVPALGIDVPVVPIRTVGDTLVPPTDPQRLGWWADGARPGAGAGSVLVTGHTVHAGGGALDDLESLGPGDRVTVRTARGAVSYVVERVRVYSKGAVADHADRLFAQDVPPRLVLVTCEDWDGDVYLSNVVVTATPLRP